MRLLHGAGACERANPGKHPNIDRLLEVIASGQGYGVKRVVA